MTPAEALAYLSAAAKADHVRLTKTSQMRLMYLTDLRAQRHGSQTTGLVWELASHGPFCRTVAFLPKQAQTDLAHAPDWFEHAQAVTSTFGHLDNAELGRVCMGSSPVRKANRLGDVLDLDVRSTNDPTAASTFPQTL
jgi:hypothetical protein